MVMAGQTPEEYMGVAKFIEFLSSSAIQAKWHQDTGYLPITITAYEQTKAEGFYESNPGTDVAIIQMTSKEPTDNSKGLRLGYFDQIRGVIDEELEAVWAGDDRMYCHFQLEFSAFTSCFSQSNNRVDITEKVPGYCFLQKNCSRAPTEMRV